jgi:RecA/RadA recombinase
MSENDAFKAAFKGALHDSVEGAWCGAVLPTGIVPVDRALVSGGFGEGRIHEIIGSWSTGKTALLYAWLIHVQTVLGGKSFLFEAEGGFGPDWYRMLGGLIGEDEPNSLMYFPDLATVEDFFDGVEKIVKVVKEKKIKVPIAIGWDSIAATGTKHLQKQGVDGSRDMTKAFKMDQGTKRLVQMIQGTRIAVVATNQTRINVGAKDWEETHTPGGRAWPYFSSARIELKFAGGPAGSKILSDDAKIGRWIKGEVIKNKMGPPFRDFIVPIYTEEGHKHPTFDDMPTRVGIDNDEALMEFYLSNKRATFGEEKTKYVSGGAAGRYKLDPSIDPDQSAFYRKQWPAVLDRHPELRTFDPHTKVKKGRKKRAASK